MKLSRIEERQAAVIARATIPLGALGGLTDRMDLGAEIGRHVALVPWWSAIIVRLALWLVWLAPLWRFGRARLFPSLSTAEQSRCLDTLARSNVYFVREAILLLKMTICLVTLADPKVLTWLGAYDLSGRPVALMRSGS